MRVSKINHDSTIRKPVLQEGNRVLAVDETDCNQPDASSFFVSTLFRIYQSGVLISTRTMPPEKPPAFMSTAVYQSLINSQIGFSFRVQGEAVCV